MGYGSQPERPKVRRTTKTHEPTQPRDLFGHAPSAPKPMAKRKAVDAKPAAPALGRARALPAATDEANDDAPWCLSCTHRLTVEGETWKCGRCGRHGTFYMVDKLRVRSVENTGAMR